MDEVERFLNLLWGEKDAERGLIEIFSGVLEAGKLKDLHGRHFKAADGAVEEVQRLMLSVPPREIYVCVSLGQERPESGRLKEVDVCGCCGLWADIDFAGAEHTTRRYPPDEAAARKVIDACGLKPTVMVHSGHGLQVWWLFKEVLYFDKVEEKIRFRALAHDWIGTLQAHAAAAGGWELDPAKDLVRVLRVAGTTNHKGEPPAVVRVLKADGPRYASLNDFEQLVCPLRKSSLVSNEEIAELVQEIDGIIGRGENHGFPADKLHALLENEKNFEATWERKRKDFGTDASRYDASLAWYGTRIGCTVKEIVQLITDHRLIHHDDPKLKHLRQDYLARTVLYGRRKQTEEVFLDQVDHHENEVLGHEGHQAMVEQLQRWLGVKEFAGVKKYGRSESKYSVVLRDGWTFEVGTAEHVLNMRQFEKAIYDNCRTRFPAMKEYIWRRVTAVFQMVAEEELMEDAGKSAQLEEWIEEYLAGSVIRAESAYSEALESREPFFRNGRVHLMAAPLRRFVLMGCMEKVADKELKVMLREAGFKGERVAAWVPRSGKSVCRYYYSRPFPDNVVPVKGEMKS